MNQELPMSAPEHSPGAAAGAAISGEKIGRAHV